MALTHVIVQRYYDKKDGDKGVVADLAELKPREKKSKKTLSLFTLSCRFSRLFFFWSSTRWSTRQSQWTLPQLCSCLGSSASDWPLFTEETLRSLFDLSFAMFKGMGSILTSTVGLIFVAAFFAKGLQNVGLITYLIDVAKNCGLGVTGTGGGSFCHHRFSYCLDRLGRCRFHKLSTRYSERCRTPPTPTVSPSCSWCTQLPEMLRAISPRCRRHHYRGRFRTSKSAPSCKTYVDSFA